MRKARDAAGVPHSAGRTIIASGLVRLEFPDGWLDFDLQLVQELLHALPERLLPIVQSLDPEFADMIGDYDSADQLVGVAFATAQVYIGSAARRHRVTKDKALSVGREHSSGATLVQMINHGANFWKHADEWDWQSPDKRRTVIVDMLERVGVSEDDYVLSSLLAKLLEPEAIDLRRLGPLLEQWRQALELAYPTGSSG